MMVYPDSPESEPLLFSVRFRHSMNWEVNLIEIGTMSRAYVIVNVIAHLSHHLCPQS